MCNQHTLVVVDAAVVVFLADPVVVEALAFLLVVVGAMVVVPLAVVVVVVARTEMIPQGGFVCDMPLGHAEPAFNTLVTRSSTGSILTAAKSFPASSTVPTNRARKPLSTSLPLHVLQPAFLLPTSRASARVLSNPDSPPMRYAGQYFAIIVVSISERAAKITYPLSRQIDRSTRQCKVCNSGLSRGCTVGWSMKEFCWRHQLSIT